VDADGAARRWRTLATGLGSARSRPGLVLLASRFSFADAHDALGDAASARAALEAGAAIDVGGSEFRFHKGRALARLGRAEEAKTLFDDLASDGAAQLAKGGEVDFFMKFGERQAHGQRMARAHYLAGLGALGHGDDAAAREQFEKALEANPNHLWARVFLRRLLSGA